MAMRLVDEIVEVRERLVCAMGLGIGDVRARRAVERALSWLGDIVDPISSEERDRWYTSVAVEEEEAMYDDRSAGAIADLIAGITTDDDVRKELKDLDEELKADGEGGGA